MLIGACNPILRIAPFLGVNLFFLAAPDSCLAEPPKTIHLLSPSRLPTKSTHKISTHQARPHHTRLSPIPDNLNSILRVPSPQKSKLNLFSLSLSDSRLQASITGFTDRGNLTSSAAVAPLMKHYAVRAFPRPCWPRGANVCPHIPTRSVFCFFPLLQARLNSERFRADFADCTPGFPPTGLQRPGRRPQLRSGPHGQARAPQRLHTAVHGRVRGRGAGGHGVPGPITHPYLPTHG